MYLLVSAHPLSAWKHNKSHVTCTSWFLLTSYQLGSTISPCYMYLLVSAHLLSAWKHNKSLLHVPLGFCSPLISLEAQ